MSRRTLLFCGVIAMTDVAAYAMAQDSLSHPPVARATAAATNTVAAHASRPGDRNCIRSTGSLIPPKPGQCLPVAGRSYSQQDLQRTGAQNVGDALRKLDPAIQ
jgi:hypothetical protein